MAMRESTRTKCVELVKVSAGELIDESIAIRDEIATMDWEKAAQFADGAKALAVRLRRIARRLAKGAADGNA